MPETPIKSKIGSLLEKLQEESWQLELLISGFAIFLVASSLEPLQSFIVESQVKATGIPQGLPVQMIFIVVMSGSWFFLLLNLILHVFMRGLWISAIGLRYVSQDVDFDQLSFSVRFDKYLRNRIKSFDLYIENLEKFCSVIFAFTFIIIFMILSVGSFSLFFFAVQKLIALVLPESISDIPKIVINTILLLGAQVYFIDFVSLGWLKRRKFISKLYYPVYRFYGWITFAFLYRPLYYNLIDNKFGKRVGYLLIPYIFISIAAATIKSESFLYFPKNDSYFKLENIYYLDEIGDEEIIDKTIIPSKFIDHNFLEVFIPYKGADEQAINMYCPNIKPDKSVGVKQTIVQINSSKNEVTPPDSVLMCISNAHQLIIDDSLYTNLSYRFYAHPHQNEHGLTCVIDIQHLKRGEHRLTVKKARVSQRDSLFWSEFSNFPFWKQ